jgi:hypothetical protein
MNMAIQLSNQLNYTSNKTMSYATKYGGYTEHQQKYGERRQMGGVTIILLTASNWNRNRFVNTRRHSKAFFLPSI